MLIAEKKKQKNIIEYILFMYQTEDLIKVYDFDMEKIEKYVITHLPISDEAKEEHNLWYREVSSQMKEEGIEAGGHLSQVQKIIEELSALSTLLLKDDYEYQIVFNNAKKFIDHNLRLAEGKVDNEIQICINGIYGLLLMRINEQPVDESLMIPVKAFGEVLSYLGYKYHQKQSANS